MFTIYRFPITVSDLKFQRLVFPLYQRMKMVTLAWSISYIFYVFLKIIFPIANIKFLDRIRIFHKLFSYLYAAAAKSLQSCLTLCDPIDGSPPGCLVPGILQARTLEWVAISFSNVWKWKVKVKSPSRVWLFAIPWTAAYHPWDFPDKSTGVGCHCLPQNYCIAKINFICLFLSLYVHVWVLNIGQN